MNTQENAMSKLTIQELNSAIMFQSWTNDQLNSMISAIKYNRAQLGRRAMRELQRGDSVRFVNRAGQYVTGTVLERKIKNVIVDCGRTRYRVPANMLEVV
jgi:hypothetical protein